MIFSGDGPLGHPRIYISLENSTIENSAPCGYCGLRFVSEENLSELISDGKDYQHGRDYILPKDLPDWSYNANHLGDHH